MESLPKISVLVTAYNAAEWIAETLRSVQEQRGVDFECLVGDDASTDGTFEVFRKLVGGDKRFRYALRAQNRGGGENIIDLIAHATGEICVELGADDYFLHDEVLAKIAAEYDAHPRLDMTSGSFVFIPNGGCAAEKPPQRWWRQWVFAKPLSWRTETARAALDKWAQTSVDPQTGLYPRYGWDVSIIYPIRAEARHYRWIPEVMYAYRTHNRNDTQGHREDQLVTEYRMRDAMEALLMNPLPWWPPERRAELEKVKAEHE